MRHNFCRFGVIFGLFFIGTFITAAGIWAQTQDEFRLKAVAEDVRIRLDWQAAEGHYFTLLRNGKILIAETTQKSYVDGQGIKPGTEYLYRLDTYGKDKLFISVHQVVVRTSFKLRHPRQFKPESWVIMPASTSNEHVPPAIPEDARKSK